MTNLNALSAVKSSNAVDLLQVLAWVDEDRVLIKDRTRHGLHRTVIARKDGMPEARVWLQAVSLHDKVDPKRLTHWTVEQDNFGILWITWKE